MRPKGASRPVDGLAIIWFNITCGNGRDYPLRFSFALVLVCVAQTRSVTFALLWQIKSKVHTSIQAGLLRAIFSGRN